MNFNLFLLVFYIFLSTSHARLGETLDQLKERYGEPVWRSNDRYNFKKAGYLLSFCFNKDKAYTVFISRDPDKKWLSQMSQEEVMAILGVFKPTGEKGEWASRYEPGYYFYDWVPSKSRVGIWHDFKFLQIAIPKMTPENVMNVGTRTEKNRNPAESEENSPQLNYFKREEQKKIQESIKSL